MFSKMMYVYHMHVRFCFEGTSLGELAAHIMLKTNVTVTKDQVFTLLPARRKNSIESQRHYNVLDARIPQNKYSLHKGHADSRHCAQMVKFVAEMASYWREFVDFYSCDDKAKIKVGILAVSKYHQVLYYAHMCICMYSYNHIIDI